MCFILRRQTVIQFIKNNLNNAQDYPQPGLTLYCPQPAYPLKINAIITGPPDSPFEGGKFTFQLVYDDLHPRGRPQLYCLTKIYHPNFHSHKISKTVLDRCWQGMIFYFNPVLLLQPIKNVMVNPILSDESVQKSIFSEYLNCRKDYDKNAKEWTIEYASK